MDGASENHQVALMTIFDVLFRGCIRRLSQ